MKHKNLDLLLVEYSVIRLAMCDIYTRDKDKSKEAMEIYNPKYEEEYFWKYGWINFNESNNFGLFKLTYIPFFIFIETDKDKRNLLLDEWLNFVPWLEKDLNMAHMFLLEMIDIEKSKKTKGLKLKDFKLLDVDLITLKINREKITDKDLKKSLSISYDIPLEFLEEYFKIIDKSIIRLHNKLFFFAERHMDLLSYWVHNNFSFRIFKPAANIHGWDEEMKTTFRNFLLTADNIDLHN